MSVKMRQKVEREIATAVVQAALCAGYTLAVDNGGGQDEYKGMNEADALAAMFATDEERLYLFRPGEDLAEGWVYFVYGNDGWDVISDYTVGLEALLAPAFAIAKTYE